MAKHSRVRKEFGSSFPIATIPKDEKKQETPKFVPDKTLIISSKAELKIKIAMNKMGSNEHMFLGEIKQFNKKYVLVDIYYPPQTNEAAFVSTDDTKFPTWFFETFTKTGLYPAIRLHGHTHPVFGTSPSGTDQNQFNEFIGQVPDYMIQLILSKTAAPHCHYWDAKARTYEPMIVVWDYTVKMEKILDAMTKVLVPKYTPPVYTGNYNYGRGEYGGYRGYDDDGYGDPEHEDFFTRKNRYDLTRETKKEVTEFGPTKARSILFATVCFGNYSYHRPGRCGIERS